MQYSIPILLSLIPAVLWAYFFWRKDFLEPEPLRMLFLSFFMGILAAGVLLFEKNFLLELVAQWKISWLVTLFFSALEEFLKIFFLLLAGKFLHLRFTQVIDGAIYGVLAGLGFAFLENFFYFFTIYTGEFSAEFLQVFCFRSLGTMLLHGLTTGIFGLFWGYAIFSKKIAPFDEIPMITFGKNFWKNFPLRILRNHILTNNIPDHGHQKIEILKEGFIIAIAIHFIFNIVLGFKYENFSHLPFILIILLLVSLLGIFSYQFLKEKNIKIFNPE